MSQTTPLLLLLDGILSQDEERVATAVHDIEEQLRAKNQRLPPHESPISSSYELYKILFCYFSVHPEVTKVPSTHDGSLPLHFAASLGDVGVANLILSQYPEAATTPNDKGKIPLHYAAREGRIAMVDFFLQACPQTASISSKKNKLALHFAAGDGHVNVVQSLLKVYPQGASLPSAKGKLPIHFAARWGHLQIANDLLYYYPDGVRAYDWEGSLPLHDAAREGQVSMARFLLERFPTALSTANLRGEIPLFPAVRSASVDLVVLLLQAFPKGGKHILQSVSEDDRISDWSEEIVELLLRGAVNNFCGCPLIQGREPPKVQLVSGSVVSQQQQQPDGEDETNPKKKKKKKNKDEIPSKPLLVQEEEQVVPAPQFTCQQCCCQNTITRSKSPILQDQPPAAKKQRVCSCVFMPLHAALECGASPHVVKHVLAKAPENYHTMIGTAGRTPLHWAVMHCKSNAEYVDLILNILLNEQAASMRDQQGRLPIHLAVLSQADVRVIEALLQMHPNVAVEPFGSMDEFHDFLPLQAACHSQCDLSTVYRLLRVDPSVLAKL